MSGFDAELKRTGVDAETDADCVHMIRDWVEDLRTLPGTPAQLKAVGSDDLASAVLYLTRRTLDHEAKRNASKVRLSQDQQDFSVLFLHAARIIVDAIDALAPHTEGRSRRIEAYASRVASLLGLTDEQIGEIAYAARIHNIGLINTSQRLFLMARQLSPDELSMARTHSSVGADMLKPIDFLQPVSEIIRYHHANWDGSGYPSAARGEQIPLGSRIIRLVDAFEAMTANRPTRPAMSPDDAVAQIMRESGVNFDPDLMRCTSALRL